MNPSGNRQSTSDRVAAIVLLAAAAALSLFALRNNDIWWLLGVGRRIVETGAFINTEPFSFTMQGQPWSPQSWLAALGFFMTHALGDAAGLILLRAVLVVGATALVLRALRNAGVSWMAAAPLVLLMLLVSHTRFIVRAHLFEYVFIAFLVGYLLTAHRRTGWSYFAIPVALQVLWVNTHPSYLLGPALAGLFYLGEFASSRMAGKVGGAGPIHSQNFRRAAVLVVLMLVACALNPNPAALLSQPFNSAQRDLLARFTLEWHSPFDPAIAAAGFHPWYEILLGVSALAVLLSLSRLSLAPVLLIGLTLWMSLQSHRFRVEFALVSVPMIGLLLARSPAVAMARDRLARMGGAFPMLPSLAAAALLLFAVAPRVEVSLSHVDRFPDTALEFIRGNDVGQRTYSTMGFGSYMVWALYGERENFIDGRNPSVSVFRDFLAAQTSEEGTEMVREKHALDAFLLPPVEESDAGMTTVHRSLSQDSTWVLVHIDERATVYVKDTSVDAEWLAQHAFREYHPLTLANRRLTRDTLNRLVLELERAVQEQPRYAQLWLDLGLALRTRGDSAGALRAFEKAVEIEPENPSAWNRIATVAIAAGDTEAALRACRRLTEISPDNAVSWHQLGRAYAAAGDRREAARAFDTAIELNRDYTDAWESAFRLHFAAQAWDDALLFTDRWIEIRPDDYLGYYYKAEVLMRLERGAQAIQACEAAIRRNPRAPGAHMLAARLYTDARDYVRALEHIEKVLVLAPGDAKALEVRAFLLEKLRS